MWLEFLLIASSIMLSLCRANTLIMEKTSDNSLWRKAKRTKSIKPYKSWIPMKNCEPPITNFDNLWLIFETSFQVSLVGPHLTLISSL